ncbi:hypothetical protein RDWZM_008087 [Blomia tropicalis]|uniref:Thioredoxin domain-containing protein n=1 Tax=Blomia tropicalis TaxID=40697 RepID=A0A9Q0M0B5_BLOTA|nr:Thioredoxin- transmembrane protein 2 [Blomia tropicalis]KAJ6216930.1 hypothetical protein RDWZM_008087 [Blomia tropicalis]
MVLINKRELARVIHPHYITNVILALSFVALKSIPSVCDVLFNSCELDYRETEILFFTGVIIIFRTRKQGSLTFLPYLSSACMLAKLGTVILFLNYDPIYGIIYICCCLVQLLLLPEPTYTGPENISYFKGTDLEEEIESDKRVVWIVELYTAWSPPCIDFSHIYSELSNKYSLNNLKFAKVDLSRSPDTATKYKINTSTLSKQLPTLIMFKNGKESMRRPVVNQNGKLVKFALTYDNVVCDFDLNNVYEECKKNPIKKDKKEKTN